MKNPDQLEGKVPSILVPQKYPAGEMSGEMDYVEGGDVTGMHAAVIRENPEPGHQAEPSMFSSFPGWLILLCGVALFWSGAYLFLFSGAFRTDVYNERATVAADYFRGSGKAETPGGGADAPPDPMAMGKRLFSQNCSSCHGDSGIGAPGQYPPLAGSEWVTGSEKRLAGIILKGLTGPITIKGTKSSYSGVMQPWDSLSDDKIAYIMTYIRHGWGNNASAITAEQVAAAREEFKSRTKAWTEEDLMQIPADAKLEGGAGAEAAPEQKPPAGS